MGRRLVVCCDGTWNSLVGAPVADRLTNVARMFLSVCPEGDDGTEQIAYYVPGVGTGPMERLRGGAFGLGLSRRIIQAYRFLVEHYRPGDELWFFGFSRGAFTARSTAGFVRQCSILRAGEADRVGEAYRRYRSRRPGDHPDAPASVAFREAHSHPPVGIRFVGVWDTVGALGLPVSPWNPLSLINRRWAFHDTTLSSSVEHARHAVAVDERRGPFRPTLWQRSPRATRHTQTLHQAWFAGVHSDVGGGYAESGLSQVAFRWMLDAAADVGLAVDRCLCPEAEGGAPPPAWMADRACEWSLGGGDPAAVVGSLARPADPLGRLHDSLTGLYRVIPRHPRAVPYLDDGDPPGEYPGQWVTRPAADRVAADAGYRTASARLAGYIDGGGEVRDRW